MESSRQRHERIGVGLAVAALVVASCNPGAGAGEVTGTIAIASCENGTRDYVLSPTFFSAEGTLDALHIRIQRGSDMSHDSDGVYIDVQNAGAIYTQLHGMIAMGVVAPEVTVPVADPASSTGVSLTLYLAESCPAGRGTVATVLPSRAGVGSVTFKAIYSPSDPSSTTAITGHFDDVVFQDPADVAACGTGSTRCARLSGWFDFIYNRGRPAQRYP